jgi:hypothetical protein
MKPCLIFCFSLKKKDKLGFELANPSPRETNTEEGRERTDIIGQQQFPGTSGPSMEDA